MDCLKDKIEMSKEYLLDYVIHKCLKCGNIKITDYTDKEVDTATRLKLEDIYNG